MHVNHLNMEKYIMATFKGPACAPPHGNQPPAASQVQINPQQQRAAAPAVVLLPFVSFNNFMPYFNLLKFLTVQNKEIVQHTHMLFASV